MLCHHCMRGSSIGVVSPLNAWKFYRCCVTTVCVEAQKVLCHNCMRGSSIGVVSPLYAWKFYRCCVTTVCVEVL